MTEYPKIQSLFKRDQNTGKFLAEWSLPVFEYLSKNSWTGTEKVDGTNIRIMWAVNEGSKLLTFGGRTDRAQIPPFLLQRLGEIFSSALFEEHFPETSVCLYGEGYGAKVQKGGGNYKKDGVDFVLFDVKISHWWLQQTAVVEIAEKLKIQCVPAVFEGTLHESIEFVKNGFNSRWDDFRAEGLVLRPTVDLLLRNGERVITKVKTKDW